MVNKIKRGMTRMVKMRKLVVLISLLMVIISCSNKNDTQVNKSDLTENKDKNEVIINVTMKSPDLSGVMKELFEKVAGLMAQMQGKTEKEIGEAAGKVATELIKERIKSGKTKEKTFDVVYTKKDDKWSPDVASNKDYFEMLTMNMTSME